MSRKSTRFGLSAIDALERRVFFAAVTVNINPSQTFQTIEGLGAAMIPWQNKPEYNDPAFFDRIVNDLGASMARASILPQAEKFNDDNDPNHFNWAGFDSTQLAAPFTFFQKLKERGVTKFVGSVWTAPAWMKTNQIFTDGGSLRPDQRAEFAEYLSAVTKLATDKYGIDLAAISLQNEPYFVEPYESTTYNADQLRETLRAVMRKFQTDNVKTQILLPEDLIFEGRVGWYVDEIMNDPETKNFIGNFAGHGLTGHWNEIRDRLAPYGRQFWMTETSGNSATWDGALAMSSGIMNAIGTANASTYLYWQFSDKAGSEKHALMKDGQPTTKYYAAKQFYRYIRPGFVHVGADSSLSTVRVTSFRDPKTGAMTTVLMNSDTAAADVSFNLSGTGLPGSYKVFRSSATENFASLGTITGGSGFSMNVPAKSIVTITNAPELTPKTGGAVPATVPIQKISDFVSTNNFFKAAMKGYNDSLTAQITGGANVNQVAANGWTPLHSTAGSAHNGSLNTLNTLLAHGANVNAVTNEGWTPLHAAAANTFTKYAAIPTLVVDKINALLAKGANVNAKDINGRTPLHWAAMMGKIDAFAVEDASVVVALLTAGADPAIKDNFGKTPLDYAQSEGYEDISDTLTAALGNDTIAPTADVIDVSPDPRTTSVTDFDFLFSERVDGFGVDDLVLTRNGSVIAIPKSAILTGDDRMHFHLAGLGGTTAANGTYTLTIKAIAFNVVDRSGNPLAVDASDTWTKGTPAPQTPYKGTPFAVGAVPITIQTEDFDNGGEGVAYHDIDTANAGGLYRTNVGVDIEATGDTGSGYHVAYAQTGEWLEYTINVASAGTYNLDFRVSSKGLGGTFRASVDGVDKTGALQVPDTLAWNAFGSVGKSNVTLAAGQHVLRVAFDSVGASGFAGNFNWIKITPVNIQPPANTTINTSTTTYVRGGTSAGSNFGADPTLVVKKHSAADSNREAYLKFDLSSLSTISSAKLRLFGSLNDTSSASVQSQVFGGSSSSWDENTLTWNTRPAATGSALATVTVTGTTAKWYEFDVTAFLNAEKAAGRNTVTLILKNPTQQNALVVFNSDDAATNRPQIVIS